MKKITILLILFLLATVAPMAAREPSSQPMLRLNTPMHTAMVRRISSNKAGRIILTCSDDKTAKLWDAEDGSLLQTLRVPAEKGNEGKLYSCALSPDGRVTALAGWTSKNGSNNNIYLFNTDTGQISQQLSGLENVIFDLEFFDNKTLAATLGGTRGIRLFRQSNGRFRLTASDTNYGAASYNVAFDSQGRLASVSWDGFLRLYDQRLNLIKKIKPQGGKKPYSLAFSGDGSRLAVGFDDSPVVEVYDGHSLDRLYRPDITGADTRKQKIVILTFGPDGSLYGGGNYNKYLDGNWWRLIRHWQDEGKGSYHDFKATHNMITDMKTLADGSIIMAGGQPDFGRYTKTGRQLIYKQGETANFRNADRFKYFTSNDDGQQITFKPSGSNQYAFNVIERTLQESSHKFQTFRDSHAGVRVTDWQDSYAPKINNRSIKFLKKNEICRSVDINDNGTILIGAGWSVYALDQEGKTRWKAQVPGSAWPVKISGNGKTAIAAHSGGEIRWYRMSDGEVLLSLYVHPDGKRWVIWTPQGYYDASPGADQLVGWHINNGADRAASMYPISKFASTYYRPDVIGQVLKFQDVDKALASANKKSKRKTNKLTIQQMLPPTVRILSPRNNSRISSNKVKISYTIETPSGEKTTGVKVFIDGRPTGTRGIQRLSTDSNSEVNVTVPSRDSTISIVAENRYAASDPARVKLLWQGEEEFIIKPKLYVLAIGVSKYQDSSLTLEFAAKDARDFSNTIKKQDGRLYQEVKVRLLADHEANRGNILDGLDWILQQTTQKDIAMVFLAGHGVNDDYGNYYYLPGDVNTNKLRRTAVPYADIKDAISNIAGKALFFIDTCHSGNILGQRRGVSDTTGIINELSSAENGVVVFASSTGRQYSLEDSAWGNGAFTKALIEGFSGKAAYRGNKITINMLDLYISERVKELTRGRQTPTTAKPNTIPDFPVALK